MSAKSEISHTNSSNRADGAIFSGCIIYLSKANVSKARFTLLESKIKANDGCLSDDPNNVSLTHVIIDDILCNDLNNCLNILKKAGFSEKLLANFKIVKVEWICKCLKQKQKVDAKDFEVNLLLNQQASQEVQHDSPAESIEGEKSGCCSDDLNPPESKKLKEDPVDNSSFVCSQVSFNVTDVSKNQLIIDELEQLADAFRNEGDKWRSYGYDKAIRAIKNYNKEIQSFEEAKKIPGVGEKISLKIKEILEEGHLRKVDEICDDKSKVMKLFSGVWGAGPATVQAWYRKGYRSLQDLETNATLTNQQKTGLKYYDEIHERMPRKEVEEISDVVKQKVLAIDDSLKVVICGSYRRKKEFCGDVDILIIKPDNLTSENILFSLHKDLKKTGFITDDLTTLQFDGNDKKYLGMCKLPGENQKHRRLDLFVVPESESACALMHYTGSALFNRSIRLLAIRKNMTLSEHALSTDSHREGNVVKNSGVILSTPTEESIFEHLGLDYRPPEQRDH